MATGRTQVIDSKGCSRLFGRFSSSSLTTFRGVQSMESMSPASSSLSVSSDAMVVRGSGPFSGLVICVTGLSKEARKQVMAATERLGGQYSPNLHPQCTHLVVQSFGGLKFEHALKHGQRNGLSVVTLGWFVDSVRRNVRLSESLYSVKSVGEIGVQVDLNRHVGVTDSEKSCLPAGFHEEIKQPTRTQQAVAHPSFSARESCISTESVLSGQSIYVHSDVSEELRKKVVNTASKAGATITDRWFVGCGATHVVCEAPSIQSYLGHTNNVVTPLWILKTAKENNFQRLVHLSADLARQVSMILEHFQDGVAGQERNEDTGRQHALSWRDHPTYKKSRASPEERQQIVDLAKVGVRNRRGHRMQTCQTQIRPITPSTLLDSICWSISDSSSAACLYTDFSGLEDGSEHNSVFFDAKGDGRDSEASFENSSRPLKESEKLEKVFKNNFLTILFPIDRFGEMGPSSRTFFNNNGFTCLQVLNYIYAFYQENMSEEEVDVAIHTDSKHADKLRSVYASKESLEHSLQFKRIDFLGSRRSFEMLKRVSGDNNSNVYELILRA